MADKKTKKPVKKAVKPKKKAAKKPVVKKIPKIPYSEKLAKKIIDLVYQGQSAREISTLKGMPCYNTMTNWKRQYPDFADKWLAAWQESAYEVGEECKDIADTVVEDKNAIAKAKLRIDVRLKSMVARKPEIYGNKIDLNVDDKRPSGEELDEKLAAAIQKAKDLG